MKFSAIQIQPKKSGLEEENAIEALIGCHDRIRHFSAMAVRLADATNEDGNQVSEAAKAVHRYFTVALPLHEADENISIDPRIQASVPATALADASAEMVQQHKEINALLKALIPLWEEVGTDPNRLPTHASQLKTDSERLVQLFDVHLTLEDQTVFPLMVKHLSAEDMDAIRTEMRERRRP